MIQQRDGPSLISLFSYFSSDLLGSFSTLPRTALLPYITSQSLLAIDSPLVCPSPSSSVGPFIHQALPLCPFPKRKTRRRKMILVSKLQKVIYTYSQHNAPHHAQRSTLSLRNKPRSRTCTLNSIQSLFRRNETGYAALPILPFCAINHRLKP